MTQVRLLFSEAWSSIRMNLSTTFAATMTVLADIRIAPMAGASRMPCEARTPAASGMATTL